MKASLNPRLQYKSLLVSTAGNYEIVHNAKIDRLWMDTLNGGFPTFVVVVGTYGNHFLRPIRALSVSLPSVTVSRFSSQLQCL